MDSDLKKCSRCKTIQPIQNFYSSSLFIDGLQNACKPCCKERANEYRKKHPDKCKAYQLKYTQKELCKESQKQYYDTHKEQRQAYQKEYYLKNKQARLEYAKLYREKKKLIHNYGFLFFSAIYNKQ